MYNTASVTAVCHFPAMNQRRLFSGTSKFGTGVPLKRFPRYEQPMHMAYTGYLPPITFLYALRGGKKAKKKARKGRGRKKKIASAGLRVKLWPTSIHTAAHYYQSNYSRQVNSALIYVNPITFFYYLLNKKITSCFKWFMNTGSASQGKDLGMLKVKAGLMQEIPLAICGESFTHLISLFVF